MTASPYWPNKSDLILTMKKNHFKVISEQAIVACVEM